MLAPVQRILFTLLALPVLVVGFGPAANAETIHVPDDYPTIQEALFAADDGDVILVADGVWTGPYNKNIDFGGLAVTVRSENGPENCVIDCEGEGRGFHFRFGEGLDSVVDGFTITNGDVVGYPGGAIYCEGASPTITNCAFTGNTVSDIWENGGAICCADSSPTISNCTFTGNTASGSAGGVYCYNSSPTIINCTFTGNTASGIYGTGQGGAVCCYSGSPTITNCTFTGNTASGSFSGHGGAIYCEGSSPTITNCTIAGNTTGSYYTDGYGGGFYCRDSSLTMRNCTIAGNTTDSYNTDGYGGGGVCYNSTMMITNCTFTGNTASSIGGGLYSAGSGDLTVIGCVLWGDAAPAGPEIGQDGGATTVSYSDVEGGWAWVYIGGGTFDWAEGNIVADPLFVDPDGPDDDPNTWEDNDYHLGTDSPCIDAADPNFVPEPDERDIDGQMRVWDGDEDGEWIVDMGSDEFGSQAPGDLDGDGCVGHGDLGILLGDWGCTTGDCPGDCDFDGDTDHADLGMLLAHWGEGCP